MPSPPRVAGDGRPGGPWGVLLAAGASTRMGRHKMLLEFEGEPLVRRAARVLLACDLSGVMVVLGRDPQDVRSALAGLACAFTLNEAYREGDLPSSIACGLRGLPPSASGALLTLADMPFVGPGHLRRTLTAARAGAPVLSAPVLSAYGEVLAPPHYVPRAAFARVLSAIDHGAAKPLPRALGDVAARAAQPPEDLLDIDDPASYEAALQRLGS